MQICAYIKEKYPDDVDCDPYSYLDDLSIATTPELAIEVAEYTVKMFEEFGFRINQQKSSLICKNEIIGYDSHKHQFKLAKNNESFKILGVNITDSFEEYNENMIVKIDRFFDAFDKLKVRTEIKHTILALCGNPRLRYFCEVQKPEHSYPVALHFDTRMKKSFAALIFVNPEHIPFAALHAQSGANIPNYHNNVNALYENSLKAVEAIDARRDRPLPVKLTVLSCSFHSPEADCDKYWTHYMSPSEVNQLPEAQYVLALAFRCNVVPDYLVSIAGEQYRCNCDELITTRTEMCGHINKCRDNGGLDFAQRHTYVKSALRRILQQYGFDVTNEPTEYSYADRTAHRPDLRVNNVVPPIAIDVSIVRPKIGTENRIETGNAAERQARDKIQHHHEAVEKAHHKFFPFVLENHGHFEKHCFLFIKALTPYVVFHRRPQFKRDVCGAVSTALASYRATALSNAAHRAQSDRLLTRPILTNPA